MGLGSKIWDLEKKPIPDPGSGSRVKKAPDTANTVYKKRTYVKLLNMVWFKSFSLNRSSKFSKYMCHFLLENITEIVKRSL
jgi:hypothetical protein